MGCFLILTLLWFLSTFEKLVRNYPLERNMIGLNPMEHIGWTCYCTVRQIRCVSLLIRWTCYCIPCGSSGVGASSRVAMETLGPSCRGHTILTATLMHEHSFIQIEILNKHISELLFDVPHLFKYSSMPTKILSIPDIIDVKPFILK